ncbi:leukocyte immunoglobulin-like receptor subfamily A member 5 isoform X1 [Macrotis lagotis]|uniref:leukocyte immunoglobulin-like receptor subfamily A member 5 isoform X1 n=1 Tax=Macrotis lagotis TaxID=92651 RepID=UPI003D68091F
MTPILSALLSLGLYLDQRIWAQAARPLRPSLKSDKGPLVPLGTSVTLTCRGPNESEMYILEKVQRLRRRITKKLQPPRTGAKFSIPSVTKNDAGNYSCFYTISSGLSEPSAPLDLVVTGLYNAPSLSALPSSQVASGHSVTLQCQAEGWHDSSALYKDGVITQYTSKNPKSGNQFKFSIKTVSPAQGGTYLCYTFQKNASYEWSAPSAPLVLRVRVPGVSKAHDHFQSPGDPQAMTSSVSNYTVSNIVCLSLAGLVLIILGVLLAEAWYSRKGP